MVAIAAVVLGVITLMAGREQTAERGLRLAASGLLLLPLLGLGVWVNLVGSERSSTMLLMAVDRSLSMSVRDVVGDSGDVISRAEAAESFWLNRPALARLQGEVLLEGRSIGDGERRAILLPDSSVRGGSEPSGLKSELAADLIRLIDGASATAARDILVLTDGIDTTGQSFEGAGEIASALGVRVHVVALGEALQGQDTAVVLSAMADRLVAGEVTSLIAQVRGPDEAPAARLIVRERRYADRSIGSIATERVLFERIVGFADPRSRRFEIPIRPTVERDEATAGGVELFEYTAELAPMEGEQRTDNNRARAVIRVTDAPIRVLVIEGEPYWDTRFLLAALRLDEGIELVSAQSVRVRRLLVRWSDAGAVQLPFDTPMRTLIAASDIVVLGRGVERLLDTDDARLVRELVVERGGGLVMLRGRPTDDPELALIFDNLAPVEWGQDAETDRAQASLTEAGRRSGMFEPRDLPEGEFPTEFDTDTGAIVAALPDLVTVTRVERERSLSVVLLQSEQDASALIAHARTGSGRVLAVLGEGLWRWAIRPPDAFASADAEAVYSALWKRMTRWLVGREAFLPGEELSVRLTPRTVRPGETARFEIRARSTDATDERTPSVRLVAPTGASQELTVRSVTDEPSARIGFGERGWSGSIRASEPGVYRVVASWQDASDDSGQGIDLLVVQEDRGEMRDVSARREELESLAERTGGLFLPAQPSTKDLDGLLARITDRSAGRDEEPVRRFEPRWDSPWVFVSLAFSLILAWWLNRRWGDA